MFGCISIFSITMQCCSCDVKLYEVTHKNSLYVYWYFLLGCRLMGSWYACLFYFCFQVLWKGHMDPSVENEVAQLI